VKGRKMRSKSSFVLFVARLARGNASIDAFKAHVRSAGFPRSTAWKGIRLEIRRAGADDLAVIGARTAWTAFKRR
jgi:hypothetical protein